jgi:hypothetical protein
MEYLIGRDVDSVILKQLGNWDLVVVKRVCKLWYEICKRIRRERILSYIASEKWIERDRSHGYISCDGLEFLYHIPNDTQIQFSDEISGYITGFTVHEEAEEVNVIFRGHSQSVIDGTTASIFRYPLSSMMFDYKTAFIYVKYKTKFSGHVTFHYIYQRRPVEHTLLNLNPEFDKTFKSPEWNMNLLEEYNRYESKFKQPPRGTRL